MWCNNKKWGALFLNDLFQWKRSLERSFLKTFFENKFRREWEGKTHILNFEWTQIYANLHAKLNKDKAISSLIS